MRGFEADGALSLYDPHGRRKYLTRTERLRFLAAASQEDAATAAFARLLAFTGCRISEALATTPAQLDIEIGSITFRTLKRRRRVHRAVPVPAALMAQLVALGAGQDTAARLWPWCRQEAWRRIKRIMRAAEIAGAQATPKGLRHGFGVANAEASIPPALTQRWLGHARLETTAIYQHVVGAEERSFAERLWNRDTETGNGASG